MQKSVHGTENCTNNGLLHNRRARGEVGRDGVRFITPFAAVVGREQDGTLPVFVAGANRLRK